ncbi:amidohydrolase family protein, partial [Sesbania bispinosa]
MNTRTLKGFLPVAQLKPPIRQITIAHQTSLPTPNQHEEPLFYPLNVAKACSRNLHLCISSYPVRKHMDCHCLQNNI